MTGLLKLLGIRDWVIVALCLALSGAVLHGAWEAKRADLAEARLEATIATIKAAQAAADARQKEHENELQERVAEAREQERAAAAQNERRLRAAVAAERADAAGLRQQLADRLGRSAEAAPDPAAAREGAAADIGDVLAEALRVQAELAAAAERHASEVRALLDAWPVSDR